ncbi:MAG: HEPN domain-containing protein [Burkholderiales bacterium]|nr:HEPN domain-containing protein [Burkholderiales bacterium]
MKQREQATLFLRKAAEDEEVLDVLGEAGSDEVYGFHAQQAVEKILKAVLSLKGVRLKKTHDLQSLHEMAGAAGLESPANKRLMGEMSAFATVYRYEEYELAEGLNRVEVRGEVRRLRAWAEAMLEAGGEFVG